MDTKFDAILVLVGNYLKAGYSPEEAENMAYAELSETHE